MKQEVSKLNVLTVDELIKRLKRYKKNAEIVTYVGSPQMPKIKEACYVGKMSDGRIAIY